MDLDRSIAPDVKEIGEVTPFEYITDKLNNGAPVYYLAHGESSLFKMVIRFDGGISMEEKTLQSQLAALMLLEGTTDKSSEEIAETIDFYGASINPTYERDFNSIKVRGLRKDFNELLKLVYEIVAEAAYAEKEFRLLKNKYRELHKTNVKRKAYQAQNEMKPLLFGEHHPYGHKVDDQAFDLINRDDLISFYQQYILNSRIRIFISGMNPEEASPQLNETFGKLNLPAHPEEIKAKLSSGNERRELHIYHDDALQSAIRLSWKTGNRNHSDFVDLKVLNTILGGYFGSRLMKNLREEKGLTYGVRSAIGSTQQTGIWVIATEVGAQHTQLALQEIYKEINRLKTTLVEDDELGLVKRYLPGKILRSLEKDFDRLNSFVELSDHQLPADYYQSFVNAVKIIDAERIRELANKYMMFDDICEVVIGKI
ncbi:MAG: M16 family metallopeptidase [Bacteroidota bacterium]